MKKKRKLKISRICTAVFMIICLFAAIWFTASFIDTNLHNQPFKENYQDYADWNIFSNYSKIFN